jgi:FtsZ-binding cell division protein ZapB
MSDRDVIEAPTGLHGAPPEPGVTRGLRSIPLVMYNLVHSAAATTEGKYIIEAPQPTIKALSTVTAAAADHNKELEETNTILQARVEELESENEELKGKLEKADDLKEQILSLLKTRVDPQEWVGIPEGRTKETEQATATKRFKDEAQAPPVTSLLVDDADNRVKILELEQNRLALTQARNETSPGLVSKLRQKLPTALFFTEQKPSGIYFLLALVVLVCWILFNRIPAESNGPILVDGKIPFDTLISFDCPDCRYDFDNPNSPVGWSFTVHADGRVKALVGSDAEHEDWPQNIPQDKVRAMLQKFDEVDFYSLHHEYGSTSEHCTSAFSPEEPLKDTIISLTAHGVTKRVFFNFKCSFEQDSELWLFAQQLYVLLLFDAYVKL